MFESQAASQRKSPLPLDGKTVLKSGEATCQVCRVSTLHERLNFTITTYCSVQDPSKDFYSSKHAAGDLIVEVFFLCVSPRLSFHHQLLAIQPLKGGFPEQLYGRCAQVVCQISCKKKDMCRTTVLLLFLH